MFHVFHKGAKAAFLGACGVGLSLQAEPLTITNLSHQPWTLSAAKAERTLYGTTLQAQKDGTNAWVLTRTIDQGSPVKFVVEPMSSITIGHDDSGSDKASGLSQAFQLTDAKNVRLSAPAAEEDYDLRLVDLPHVQPKQPNAEVNFIAFREDQGWCRAGSLLSKTHFVIRQDFCLRLPAGASKAPDGKAKPGPATGSGSAGATAAPAGK